MGRKPCCDKVGLKKGPWTLEEDKKLVNFITTHGQCCWRTVPELAGLSRCGKSCRLRWTNYLRPDLKRGVFSESEEKLIIDLHSHVGNRWSKIASFLPGRTDNEIKNYWNTHIKKKLKRMGLDPATHRPVSETLLQNPPPAAENTEAATGLPKTLEDGKPIQEELQAVSVLMKHVKEEESEQPNLPFDAANTQIQSKMEEELQVPEMMNAQTPLLLHAEYWWDYNDFVAGLVDGSEDNTSWVNPESIAGHMFETQGVVVPESSNPHFFLQPVDYFPQETSNKIFPLDF